jgi:peptide/nickel transport system substrate-binding protein
MLRRRDAMKGGLVAAGVLAAPRIAWAQKARPLIFVPQADLAVLDPIMSTAIVGRTHGLMVFDTLYGLDSQLRPQPQMVGGEVVEDDGRLWRITLRPGLVFHNGEKVRARDVVASLNRWSRNDTFGQALFAVVDELKAESDDVFVFRLKRPFPQLSTALAKIPVSMPFIQPADLITMDRNVPMREIIGSGPFRFMASETVPGAHYAYERFAGYVPRDGGGSGFTAGPKRVSLERVEWKVMPDGGTAASALRAGEIDWWDQALPDLLRRLAADRNIVVEPADHIGLNGYLRMNHLAPPFDNPAIRRALLGAVDQGEQMLAVMGEDAALYRTGVGIFTAGSPMANDAGLEVLTGPRDLPRVRSEIMAAGYKGETVVLMDPSDFPSISMMAQISADMLRKIGFQVDLQAMDWATLLARRNRKETTGQSRWNIIAMANSGFDMMSPATHLQLRAVGANGPAGWPSSPKMEALRDAWFAAPTLEAQQQIAREMQLQNWQDVVFIPLGQYFPQTAYRKTVQRRKKDLTVFWDVDKA